jgi:hypothetical protein
MLKMKSDTPTQTAAEAAADSMRAALCDLRKPASLELAERNLTAARTRRAEVASEHRECCRAFRRKNQLSTAAPRPEISTGEAALLKCDGAIKAARAKLDEARAQFAPYFLDVTAGPTREIAIEIATRATEIEKLIEALAEGRRLAERNGIAPPRLLAESHHLRECINGIRGTIGR